MIFPQDIGEDSGKGGIETGKAQCSLQLLLLAADGSRLLGQSDNLLCIGFQLMPFFRDVDFFADAVEQLHADFFLQLLNLYGNCGLGIGQLLRCLGKTACFNDFQKCD